MDGCQRSLEFSVMADRSDGSATVRLARERRPVVVRREAKRRNVKLYEPVIETHSFGNRGAGSPNVHVRSINSI